MFKIFRKIKSLKIFTTFMIMCFLLTVLAFPAQASTSKRNVPTDGIIEVDTSLAKSSTYTIELYKGSSSKSFTTIKIQVDGSTDPTFTVTKDGSKILLEPMWDETDSILEMDIRAYLDTVSSYKYTVDSSKTNFDKDDISNLKDVTFSDIEGYNTGGKGILFETNMDIEDMRELLMENSSSLKHVKDLEKKYAEKNKIEMRNPIIDSSKVSDSSMDIVGTALNVDDSKENSLRLEFLDGKTKRTRDLEYDLDDDVKRSASIEIDIVSRFASGDDLDFPITITMKPPTGISTTDLYILHYFDGIDGDYEIIRPRKNSGSTITFSTTSFSTFVFVNTSTRGDVNTDDSVNKDKINGSWGKDSNGWYFIDERGFNPNTTWKKVGSKWFYFDVNGYMETGWLELGRTWYYLNSGGDMATGWKQTGGKWYFLNGDGDMATGWKQTGGKWYFLNPGGDMATGWKLTGGKWYFLNPSGDMATGWKEINKVWYYMYSNGQMAANTVTPDGYRVNANGAWIK